MEPVVTVGVDGSPASLSAAHWAAREARIRKLPLRLLFASVVLAAADGEAPAEWATRLLHDAAREVHESFPGLAVREDLVPEGPVAALLAAAEASEILVLGSRGIGPLANFFLGDTGLNVVAQAERPVVLVRHIERAAGQPPPSGSGDVIVGLDPDHLSGALLEFAFEAAAQRGAGLRAVHSRARPLQAYTRRGVVPDTARSWADGLRRELKEALRPWRRRFPRVRVVENVALESPAQAIVHAASGAELLVLGRRRNRPPLAPPLGAVTHAAIHHATCPVAVIPYG